MSRADPGRRRARLPPGRTALVTGASSGIGAATARLLDAEGIRVAVVGRDLTALVDVARDFTGPVTIQADLATSTGPSEAVAQAVAALGRLDIVISNAGAGWAGPFQTMTAGELDAVLDINLRAGAHLLRAALPHLIAGGGGQIVLVGSITGLLPLGGEAAYSASKAGLAALGEALRVELRPRGVKVSVVNPGVVATDFFRRRNQPYARAWPSPIPASEVAEAILYCLAHGCPDRVVPGWLGLPVRIRRVLPNAYRMLSDRLS